MFGGPGQGTLDATVIQNLTTSVCYCAFTRRSYLTWPKSTVFSMNLCNTTGLTGYTPKRKSRGLYGGKYQATNWHVFRTEIGNEIHNLGFWYIY